MPLTSCAGQDGVTVKLVVDVVDSTLANVTTPCPLDVTVVFAVDPPATVYFADAFSPLTVIVTLMPGVAAATLIFGADPPAVLTLTELPDGSTATFEGATVAVVGVVPVLAVVSVTVDPVDVTVWLYAALLT